MTGALLTSLLAVDKPLAQETHRPAKYIENLKGLENGGRVAEGMDRTAMPTEEGMESFKKLGIRMGSNLRHNHESKEKQWCRERGLEYVRIELESSDAPTDEAMRQFLRVVMDPPRQPLFFLCPHGKDRAGTMCAVYRRVAED